MFKAKGASRKEIGDQAEALALAHLERQGLSLVQRNYRVARGPSARGGEVDACCGGHRRGCLGGCHRISPR